MTTLTAPLVGAAYRPPAKLVLGMLASGTELMLDPEPTNEHDPLALRVMVTASVLTQDDKEVLQVHLPGYGLTLDEVLSQPIWLGYIARTREGVPCGNAQFLDLMAASPGYKATLGFSPEGKPQVILTEHGQEQ